MKKFKKIMAVLVAAIMVVAMTVPAWAELSNQGGNSLVITVNNAKKGETYTAYKIFDETEAASLSDVYVKVPVSTVKDERNTDIKYYTVSGGTTTGIVNVGGAGTEIALADRASASGDVWEKVKSPVAYTIESSSIWYNTVKAYAAAENSGLYLTPTQLTPVVDAETVYLVTFDDKFEAAKFAEELKERIDKANNTTSPKLVDIQHGYAAKSTPAGDGIGTDSGVTATLYVGTGGGGEATQKRGNGYYFVDTTTGAFCALDTAMTPVTVYEKNTVPTVEKWVWNSDATTPDWDKFDNAQIYDDTVYFKLEVTDGKGTDKDINIYDMMESTLDLKTDSIEVYVPLKTTPQAANYASYYTFDGEKPEVVDSADHVDLAGTYYLKVTEDAERYTINVADGQNANDSGRIEREITFSIKIDDKYVTDSLGTGDKVYIFYNAKLNGSADMASADMASGSNDNAAWLEYSEQITEKSTVKVYTHAFDLVKDDKNKNTLVGAKFELYRGNPWDNTNPTGGKLASDAATKKVQFEAVTGGYTVYDGAGTIVTELVSTSDKITIKGLDIGDYYLVETQAPAGYNALTAPIKITIDQINDTLITTPVDAALDIEANKNKTKVTKQVGERDGYDVTYRTRVPNLKDATVTSNVYQGGGVEVVNTAGTELPSTGGMGTTVLYIVGGMLVILAGAYLFFSRKRTA